MKRLLKSLIVLSLLITSCAYAEVYTYTGNNFTTVTGEYTTAMRLTGTIVTNGPIPPNSVDFDFSEILTSWSFFDGVQTLNNGNAVIYPSTFDGSRVTTDGLGNITSISLIGVKSPMTTVIGGLGSAIQIFDHHYDSVFKDGICRSVSAAGYCSEFNASANQAYLRDLPGVWVTSSDPVNPIPATAQWSLMLLALLLALVGFVRLRSMG